MDRNSYWVGNKLYGRVRTFFGLENCSTFIGKLTYDVGEDLFLFRPSLVLGMLNEDFLKEINNRIAEIRKIKRR